MSQTTLATITGMRSSSAERIFSEGCGREWPLCTVWVIVWVWIKVLCKPLIRGVSLDVLFSSTWIISKIRLHLQHGLWTHWWPFLKGSSDVAVHQVLLNQLPREVFIATCKTCNVPAQVIFEHQHQWILVSWRFVLWLTDFQAQSPSEGFPIIAAPTRCPSHLDSLMMHEFAAFTLLAVLTGALFSYPGFSAWITKVAWTSVQHFALLSYLTENRCKYY